jgi:hypothetical protein
LFEQESIMRRARVSYQVIPASLLAVLSIAAPALAQDEAAPGRRAGTSPATTAWFGLPLPPDPSAGEAVVVGSRGPRPVVVPASEPIAPEFEGKALRADLEEIVALARESQRTREIGSGQLWGRVAGFPSGTRKAAWSAERFRRAGIPDVKLQSITQDAAASFWLPLKWELTLLADPAFGSGTTDITLASAMPLAPTQLVNGTLTAPLVYVGNGSPAVIEHIDVTGKIAVQLVVPQAHMVFERATVVPQAQALIKRGAVAVFNIMRQPGNELARDFSNCGGPCVNIGGHDGHFLEGVLEKAAAAGIAGRARATLTLDAESRTGLTADNAVAVIPGSASDEVLIVNAHYDGWFEGASATSRRHATSPPMGIARPSPIPEKPPSPPASPKAPPS